MSTMNSRTRSMLVFLALAGAFVLIMGLLGALRAMSVSAQDGPVGEAQTAAGAAALPPQTGYSAQPLSVCRVITLQQRLDGYLGCRDTTITAEHPDQNFGDRELVLGMRGNARILVAFLDLEQAIPRNAKVVEATLGLFVYNDGQTAGPINVAAYPVVRPWKENEATWRRATSLAFWGKEGCDDTTTDRAPTPLDQTRIFAINTWYTWDVTSAAQDWLLQPTRNQGLVLIPTTTNIGGEFDIWHSEYIGPYLEVKYCLGPDVEVTKEWAETASGVATVGDPVAFTIRVVNTGTTTITDLTVTDTFDPQQLSFTSASVEPDMQTAGTVVWTSAALDPFLPLAPGESFTLDLQFEARSPAARSENCVTVEGLDQYGQVVQPREACEDVEIVPPPPSMTVSKQLTQPPNRQARVGDSVTFLLRIANSGKTSITRLEATDTYEFQYLTLTGQSVVGSAVQPGRITWVWDEASQALPLLPDQDFSWTITFEAVATTDVAANRLSVLAVDEYGHTVGPLQDEDYVEIRQKLTAGVSVSKELTHPPSGIANVGETVTFVLRVTNTGQTTLTDLEITDTYNPIFLTLTGYSEQPTTQSPGTIFWDSDALEEFLPLAGGDSFTIALEFRARQETPGTTQRVSVQGTDEHGQPVGPAHAEEELAIERRIYKIYLPKITANYTPPTICDPRCGQWDVREEFNNALDLSDWRRDDLGISDAIKVTADGWVHLSLAAPNTQFPLIWRDDLFEGTDDCFCLEVRFRHDRLQRHGTTVSVNSGDYPLSDGLPRRAGESENFRLDRIEDILSIHHNHPSEHPVEYLFEIRMIRNGDWRVVWPAATQGRTEEHLHDTTAHTARVEFDGAQYKLYVDQMQTSYGTSASDLRPKSLYIGSHATQSGAWPWTDVLVDYVYVSRGRWVGTP